MLYVCVWFCRGGGEVYFLGKLLMPYINIFIILLLVNIIVFSS